MKNKRSLATVVTTIVLVIAMCLSLAACGSSAAPAATAALAEAADSSAAATDTSATDASDKVFNIGVCQLVQHEALDAATKGFIDTLTEKLGADKVNFDVQVAAGDSATCSTIVNSFVSKKYDLILANATAALQAAYNATSDIPSSAPPSRSTAWLSALTTSPAPSAATSPARPTSPRLPSRRI